MKDLLENVNIDEILSLSPYRADIKKFLLLDQHWHVYV